MDLPIGIWGTQSVCQLVSLGWGGPLTLFSPLCPPFTHLGAQAQYLGICLDPCLVLIPTPNPSARPVASASETHLCWMWLLPLAAATILVLLQASTISCLDFRDCSQLASLLLPVITSTHPRLSARTVLFPLLPGSQAPLRLCSTSLTSAVPPGPRGYLATPALLLCPGRVGTPPWSALPEVCCSPGRWDHSADVVSAEGLPSAPE